MTAPGLLVWDSSALLHATRADRVDVLADLAQPWDNVTTAAVLAELDQHGLADSVLAPGWLREEHVDGLDELAALVRWGSRVGMTARHNRGEATVLAWAEAHGALAVLDDADAREVARFHGLEVHGTLWLCAEAVKDGRASEVGLAGFLDALLATAPDYLSRTVGSGATGRDGRHCCRVRSAELSRRGPARRR